MSHVEQYCPNIWRAFLYAATFQSAFLLGAWHLLS